MRWALVGALGCAACSVTTDLDGLQCADGPCGGSAASDGGLGGGGGASGSGGHPVDTGGKGGGDGGSAGSGGASPRCDPTKPFLPATPVGELDDPVGTELGARLTDDERYVFYTRSLGGEIRILSASRTSKDLPFKPPAVVANLTGAGVVDAYPSVTGNGLTIYFHSDREGNFDLYQAGRLSDASLFNEPLPVTSLATSLYDAQPYIAPDGSFLLFVRGDVSSGPLDIFQSAWNGVDFDPPVGLSVNGSTNEAAPVVTSDGLTLYFASDRTGGSGGLDVWRATRARAMSGTFGKPENVTELNTDTDDAPTWISPDECSIYLQSPRNDGSMRIYHAARPP